MERPKGFIGVQEMHLRPEAEERIRKLKNDPIAALNSYEGLREMGRHKGLIQRRMREFATPSEAALTMLSCRTCT